MPEPLIREPFRISEWYAQLLGNHQRHECAFNQRPAYDLNPVRSQTGGNPLCEALYRLRMQTQQLQIKPQLAMVARLQPEVSLPRRQKADHFLLNFPLVHGGGL